MLKAIQAYDIGSRSYSTELANLNALIEKLKKTTANLNIADISSLSHDSGNGKMSGEV